MISLSKFLSCIAENAARIHAYVKGADGNNGTCDCVGLIIGALRLAGVKYSGTHGSNYFARKWTVCLARITSVSQLSVGDLVYKAYTPGQKGYDLPDGYKTGTDLRDYYHIGVVTSVNPLCIAHCSTGGMHYDTSLGKWAYFGQCKGVDYITGDTGGSSGNASDKGQEVQQMGGKAIVDVPNDGTLNIRAKKSTSSTKLGTFREGEEVEVLEDSGEWCKVSFRGEGYVQSKFLKAVN